MRIESLDLVRVAMPLVRPFRTSFGVELERDALLVHVVTDEAEGWGECVSGHDPLYSPEYVDGSIDVIARYLVPWLLRLQEAEDGLEEQSCRRAWAAVRGHPMARAAVETAVLDALLVARGERLIDLLATSSGGEHQERVPCGVSVGIPVDESVESLLAEVATYLEAGYRRIKLKIEPGWDVQAVRAVRETWPDVPLQVDANQAYTLADAHVAALAALDPFDLLLVEQPLSEHDLLGHVALAERIGTPVCLDESVISLETCAQVLDLGAASIINIKPGRVGGYLESVAIHDLCRERGVPVWCGGMLETGIGRAANLALASLPGFVLPGDTSASSRYYARDVTAPFVLDDEGCLDVPTAPGAGVAPDAESLAALEVWRTPLVRDGAVVGRD